MRRFFDVSMDDALIGHEDAPLAVKSLTRGLVSEGSVTEAKVAILGNFVAPRLLPFRKHLHQEVAY